MRQRRSFLKILVFAGVLIVALLGVSTAAGAWSEGPDPNGFGTHDWLLQKAAGPEMADVDWFVWEAAQPVSDDPDTVYYDSLNHAYDVWGLLRLGTAPFAVKTHFALAVTYLKAGWVEPASKEVALMAHYYDDVWNPWHTTYEFSNLAWQARYHIPFEDDVWANNGEDKAPAVTYDGFTLITNAAAATKTAAGISRTYYSAVSAPYVYGGFTAGVDAAVDTVLNKAANGLADLIKSVSQLAGR
jgi:hypothetical protein